MVFLMLKNCFSLPKLLYFLRTSTCFNHPALLEKYDKTVRDGLSKVCNVNFDDISSTQLALPDSGRFGKKRFGKNMAADVSAKKYAETSQAKTIAETFRMICGAYPVYARSPSPSQRPAPTTIAWRSPFPLGLCSCSTSLSKMEK